MKQIVFLFFFFISKVSMAQEDDFKKYYIVDSTMLKNKVRSVAEIPVSGLGSKTTTEYDSLGRKVLFYYGDNRYKFETTYKKHSDTILRFLSNVSERDSSVTLHEIAKYLYNSKGEIILYADCYKQVPHNAADMTKFYYDSAGSLITKIQYHTNNYSLKINYNLKLDEYYSVCDSIFDLIETAQYFYNNVSQLYLIKNLNSKGAEQSTDSLFYSPDGKLMRSIHFQKIGGFERMRLHNVSNITDYIYTDSSRVYSKTVFSDDYKGERNGDSESVIEFVLYPNGLRSKEYLIHPAERILYRTYQYRFYK